jgi:hypothetical protein
VKRWYGKGFGQIPRVDVSKRLRLMAERSTEPSDCCPLLRYRLHYLKLHGGERFCLLLPKLSLSQLEIIQHRLTKVGYVVSSSKVLRAGKGTAVVHVNPAGLCWSNVDVTDVVAPIIPEMLEAEKDRTPLEVIESEYFSINKVGRRYVMRLNPRIESSSFWGEMRATNMCGLTPDEHEVYARILSQTSGCCQVMTDYPTEGCRIQRVGRRQYYQSTVETAEAASNLRVIGEQRVRNVYLPKTNLLQLNSMPSLSPRDLEELFLNLGEWCYLAPGQA